MRLNVKKIIAATFLAGMLMPTCVYAAQEDEILIEEIVIDETEEDIQEESIPEDVPEESSQDVVGEEVESDDSQAMLTGWYQEDGKYRYAKEDGTYLKNEFLQLNGKKYYFDEEGWLVTGWRIIDGESYYFKKSGKEGLIGQMFKGRQNVGNYTYYFGTEGKLQTGFQTISGHTFYFKKTGDFGIKGRLLTGWLKSGDHLYYLKKSGDKGVKGRLFKGLQNIGTSTYYFGTDGKLQTGFQTIKGHRYYFKLTGDTGIKGKMLSGWLRVGGQTYYLTPTGAKGVKGRLWTGWQSIGGKDFYFAEESGKMLTGWQKIGKYTFYFKATGESGVKGQMFLGLKNVSGKKYYFKKTGAYGLKGGRFENRTYTVNGTLYAFDSDGVATVMTGQDYVYATDPVNGKQYKVETQFFTDPQIGTGANQVTEKEFLAAVLYTEAGNQGVSGQTMVGMVIHNRMMTSGFPDSLKFVVYANQQFAVARNGMLTNLLIKIRDNDANTLAILNRYGSFEAADNVLSIYKNYKSGKTTKRLIPGVDKSIYGGDFSHTYFMTPAAFDRIGLSESKCESFVYNGHIYFKKWVSA